MPARSRLAMEIARTAGAAETLVVSGECRPPGDAGEGGPLHPLRELLEAVAAACRKDPVAAARLLGDRAAVLRRVLPGLDPSAPGAPLRDGAPAEDGPPSDEGSLPPAEARQRLFSHLAETLGTFVASTPFLLLLDDLQWADAGKRSRRG